MYRLRLWGTLVLAALAPGVASPLEAVATAISPAEVTFSLRRAADWAPGQVLVTPAGDRFEVLLVSRQQLRARPVSPSPLRLGQRLELEPVSGEAAAVGTPTAPSPRVIGTIARIHGEEVWVDAPSPPSGEAVVAVQRDNREVGFLTWEARDGARWRARWQGPGEPRLGDRVEFTAVAATAPAAVLPPAGSRPARAAGLEDIVPPDDPIYDLFAALAARGYLPKATHRQFAGLETVFTRRQLVQFLSLLIEHLLDGEQAWPVQAMSDQSAAQVATLVGHFRDELKASGVDVQQVDEALQELGVADPATLLTGTADLRIVSDENLTGRAEATLLGSFRSRLRYGLSVGTRADEPFPADRDRETIESYHLEYDLARHLTLGIGRRSRLLGPGRNGLLLSDRAEPIDSVYLAWRTQVFGRPFSIQQQTGGFGFDRGRYVTIRRYQYLPARQLTLGLNFGLITDLGGQAVASFFLPDYAYRFVGGNTSGGGRGNWLGSFDAAYRLSREWAVYGEMFADEFDFSPSPPRTAQRLGYLAGVHYTPRWALPGTSYRLEGTLIPDRGTYVGQQDVGLAWLREGVLFGHPYGEDSAGWRLDIHHRLAPNFDVTLGAEHFRQLRSRAIQPRTTRLELALHYDLNHWSAVGTGIRFRRFEDRAGIANNDLDDDAWYFETRLGY